MTFQTDDDKDRLGPDLPRKEVLLEDWGPALRAAAEVASEECRIASVNEFSSLVTVIAPGDRSKYPLSPSR